MYSIRLLSFIRKFSGHFTYKIFSLNITIHFKNNMNIFSWQLKLGLSKKPTLSMLGKKGKKLIVRIQRIKKKKKRNLITCSVLEKERNQNISEALETSEVGTHSPSFRGQLWDDSTLLSISCVSLLEILFYKPFKWKYNIYKVHIS